MEIKTITNLNNLNKMKTKTKFRNAFLMMCFCLLNFIGYGQTKEETIGWLKEKLGKSLYIGNGWGIQRNGGLSSMDSDYFHLDKQPANIIQKISIDECNIKIEILIRKDDDVSKLVPVTWVFPTMGIKVIDGVFFYKSKIFYYTYEGKEYYPSTTLSINIQANEENLNDRLKKAFDHLATFCPKKKETF